MKKNKKTIPLILFIIATFFLLYTLYESEIKYEGNEYDKYFKYYLICSFLFICSIISFYLKKGTIINISFIFISVLITLYLINSVLILKKTKINFDNRTKFQFYQDLKKVENDIALSMYSHSLDSHDDYPLFSLSDRSNKKTIHCNESGYYSIFHTDRYGFNNPDTEWEKNEIEFLLVGDSSTHGACVNEPDTISGNLKKMIDNGGVLNLGYTGNGPLAEYATLREYSSLKKINRVLWLYTERNDLSDLIHELKNKTLLNYLNDRTFTQKLYTRQDEIDNKLEKVFNKIVQEESTRTYPGKIISFIRLYDLRSFINARSIKFNFNNEPAVKEVSNKILENFSKIVYLSKTLLDDNETKFYFVYLPDYFRYKIKANQNDEFNKYKNIINIVKKLNIPIIDINKDLFEKHPDPLSLFPFIKGRHYSASAYKLVAKTILEKITEYEKNF